MPQQLPPRWRAEHLSVPGTKVVCWRRAYRAQRADRHHALRIVCGEGVLCLDAAPDSGAQTRVERVTVRVSTHLRSPLATHRGNTVIAVLRSIGARIG